MNRPLVGASRLRRARICQALNASAAVAEAHLAVKGGARLKVNHTGGRSGSGGRQRDASP